MIAVAPASAAASRPSAKGKNASDATALPTVRDASQPYFSAASAAFIAAIRLESRRFICPAPIPAVAPPFGIYDGVRFDVTRHGPGEQAVFQFLFGRLALRDDLEVGLAYRAIVARLDEQPTGDRLDREPFAPGIRQLARDQQPQVLLSGECRARASLTDGAMTTSVKISQMALRWLRRVRY